jgi:hypothetical protein
MKKGDFVFVAADDNKVRSSASQNHAAVSFCTEKFFLRTQYIHSISSSPQISREVGGGRLKMVSVTHMDGPG